MENPENLSTDTLRVVLSIPYLADKLAFTLRQNAHIKEELAGSQHSYDCMYAELSREIDELKEAIEKTRKATP